MFTKGNYPFEVQKTGMFEKISEYQLNFFFTLVVNYMFHQFLDLYQLTKNMEII